MPDNEGWAPPASSDDLQALKRYAESFEDPSVIELVQALHSSPLMPIVAKTWLLQNVQHGLLSVDGFESAWREMEKHDLSDPMAMDAVITEAQRSSALKYLPPVDRALAERVPSTSAWTRRLNACTVKLPTGRPGIVMDKSMVLWTRMVARGASLAIDELCDDQQRLAGMQTVGFALLYAATQDFYFLKEGYKRYGALPETGRYMDLVWPRLSSGMDMFILLHEYGHALLGHLDAPALGEVGPERRQLEHEADTYALRLLMDDHMAPPAWSICLLMRSFAIAEAVAPAAVSTHPSWRDRWSLLRHDAHAGSKGAPPLVDKWFDDIEGDLTEWVRGFPLWAIPR